MTEPAAEPKKLQVEYIKIPDLSEDPANARLHGPQNIDAIVASLRRFGQRKPIVVDRDNVVRAGNGLLRAAKELGWDEIACVRMELTGADAMAYAIADNRTGELSSWDYQILGAQLNQLVTDGLPIQELGWTDQELNAIMQAPWQKPSPEEGAGGEPAELANLSILVTPSQWQTITRAIQSIRNTEQDQNISEGRCVELICADFLAGAPTKGTTTDEAKLN